MIVTILGFEISTIVLWLVLALIFIVVEAITAGLATIWFAGGAFLALIAALLKCSFPVQIVIFLVSSICLLVFTRKIFVEKLKLGSIKTNVDALIGSEGLVVKAIDPFELGQVKVNGQIWSAVCQDPNGSAAKGENVTILSVEGVKLVVGPIKG